MCLNRIGKEERCPTGTEVGLALGLHSVTAGLHMVALQKADGLPFPIPLGYTRVAAHIYGSRMIEEDGERHWGHAERMSTPAPVDATMDDDRLLGSREGWR